MDETAKKASQAGGVEEGDCVKCGIRKARHLARFVEYSPAGARGNPTRIPVCADCARALLDQHKQIDVVPVSLAGSDLAVSNRLEGVEKSLGEVKSKFSTIYLAALTLTAVLGIAWAVLNAQISSKAETRVSEALNRQLPLSFESRLAQIADERAIQRVKQAHEAFASWGKVGEVEHKRVTVNLRLEPESRDSVSALRIKLDGDFVGENRGYTSNPTVAIVRRSGQGESYEHFDPHKTLVPLREFLGETKGKHEYLLYWIGGNSDYVSRINLRVPRHASHLAVRLATPPGIEGTVVALAVPFSWYEKNVEKARTIVLKPEFASNIVLNDVQRAAKQHARQQYDAAAFVSGQSMVGSTSRSDVEMLLEIARPPLWNTAQADPTVDLEVIAVILSVHVSFKTGDVLTGPSTMSKSLRARGTYPLMLVESQRWEARSNGILLLDSRQEKTKASQ